MNVPYIFRTKNKQKADCRKERKEEKKAVFVITNENRKGETLWVRLIMKNLILKKWQRK